MANQTITFNQPGMKIFMGDEIDFITNSSNTLTVNIANTGENYLIVPTVYNVTGRNGDHPSGNASGNYLSLSAASNAKASLIQSAYNGYEYDITVGSYLTGATFDNSNIFDEMGLQELPSESILYINNKGVINMWVVRPDYNFDSNNQYWPSSINSVGFWLSTFSSDSDLGYYKINDFSTYSSSYFELINILYSFNASKSDTLFQISRLINTSCDLYTAINNHNYTDTSKITVCLCYIVYPTTYIENVSLSEIGGYSNISYTDINFLYNGSAPSQVIRLGSDGWKSLKVIGNEKVDTSSGRTESVIIVD